MNLTRVVREKRRQNNVTHARAIGAVRRAARVTVAACLVFYVCRYLLGDATTALYALFGAVAMGALSDVSGRPAQRTRTYLAALVVGLALVALGTLLAVSTWAAAAGMLVVGFAVAYAGVGGPRAAGLANGLQLFYVLPCFPPYAPDTLGQRLTGLAVGVALLALADRVLWPDPAPPALALRVADAAGSTAAYAHALRAGLLGADNEARLTALRAAADHAADGLRLSNLAVAQRPSGPGVRDRSLSRAAAAVRVVTGRLGAFADLLQRGGPTPSTETAEFVGAVGSSLEGVRDALRGTGPAPAADPLDVALEAYLQRREQRLLDPSGPQPPLRTGLTAEAITETARTLVLATRGAVGAPVPDQAETPADFWFLHASRTQLWWRRLRAHLTPRSVYLQNALRLAFGLAAARVVAGVLDLSHGFWVILATLSLMRTSAVASRAALLPAFAGTVAGAIVAGAVLTVVGYDTAAYAWALPIVMIASFAAGPVLGLAAGQAGFTVVVAMIFAQVAPADWRLAEARLLDVVVGGLVGALIGAAVWPRGGGGEVRRVAAAGLRAGADEIVATIGLLTGSGGGTEPSADLSRLAGLFDDTYAQYRTEPPEPNPPDWLAVLVVVQRMTTYARTLRIRHPAPGPLPWPELAARVRAAAADVAAAYREIADALDAARPPTIAATEQRDRLTAHRLTADFAEAPEQALRVLDAWGWVDSLVDDLARIEHALDPPVPPRIPEPPRAGVA